MRGGTVLVGVVIAGLAVSGVSVMLLFWGSRAPCPGCPEEMGSIPPPAEGMNTTTHELIGEGRKLSVARDVTPAVLDRLEMVALGLGSESGVSAADLTQVRRWWRLSVAEMLANRTDLAEGTRERLKQILLRSFDDPAARMRINAVAVSETARVFDDPRFVARVEALKNDQDPEVAARAERSSILWTPEQRAEAARRWAEEKDARR